jgi:Rap1a immunity proteins
MRHYLSAGNLALVLLLSGPASAQTVDGNSLLEACNAPLEQGLAGFCIGYILGSWEGMNWGGFKVWKSAKPEASTDELNSFIQFSLDVCAPAEVQNSQIKDVVTKYLVDHPEVRHEGARGLINVALTSAFPCAAP